MKTQTRARIVEIIKEKNSARPGELAKELGISPQALHRHLRRLVESNLLKRHGLGPRRRYALVEQKQALDRMQSSGQFALRYLKPIGKTKIMGEVRAKVRLENYEDRVRCRLGQLPEQEVRFREINALVDTGAVLNVMPQELVQELGLRIIGAVTAQLANDQRVELARTETMGLTVAGRTMVTDCLVGPAGCTPLIGQIVMESLDLIVDPARRTLV